MIATVPLWCRVPAAAKAELQLRADHAGLTLSAYVRQQLLYLIEPPRDYTPLRRARED